MKPERKRWAIKQYAPTIGIVVFVGLYIYSSQLYPGGSQDDLNSVGFDWINNYWCNLLNEQGMNGQVNSARSFAITALIILCLSLILFFNQFASTVVGSRIWRHTIRWSGLLSMICAMLIFTKYHDLMTLLSSVFGLLVVVGVIREVMDRNRILFKWSGLFCLLLLAINNYIYYSKHLIEYLPLIQKLTFACVLAWVVWLNIKLAGEGVS